jgi:hypothetical protein
MAEHNCMRPFVLYGVCNITTTRLNKHMQAPGKSPTPPAA